MSANNILDTLKIVNSVILYKEQHIDRTYEAFLSLNKKIERAHLSKVYAAIEKLYKAADLRIIFDADNIGIYHVEMWKVDPLPNPLRLELRFVNITPTEYKWADRQRWQELLKSKSAEADDILIVTPDNFLRETCRFNLFCYDKVNDIYLTPELSTGCVNGAYRRYCLVNGFNNKKLVEKNISLSDIEKFKIYVANSVRGVIEGVICNDRPISYPDQS